YGGILEKYVGDAIMAVFGIPVESEHDAVRAVAAGLDMQRELDDRPLAGRYRMRVRVGVATGEALVDLAAAHNSGEAMVSGDVVATAARLQALAPDGGVLVSAATRRATTGSVRYAEPPRQVTIAGKSRPATVYLAEGLAGRIDLDDDTVPLAGRSHELDLVAPSDVERLTELLGPLAGLPGRSVNAGEIESAWREVLVALARNMPTVLVVEDLHFANPAMLRFLAGLVESVDDVPLIVLCTYRPELLEDKPTWAGGPPGTLTVSLGPLRGGAARGLILGLLRRYRLPEALAERLCAITGGNPMYAVEYVRMLAERTRG